MGSISSSGSSSLPETAVSSSGVHSRDPATSALSSLNCVAGIEPVRYIPVRRKVRQLEDHDGRSHCRDGFRYSRRPLPAGVIVVDHDRHPRPTAKRLHIFRRMLAPGPGTSGVGGREQAQRRKTICIFLAFTHEHSSARVGKQRRQSVEHALVARVPRFPPPRPVDVLGHEEFRLHPRDPIQHLPIGGLIVIRRDDLPRWRGSRAVSGSNHGWKSSTVLSATAALADQLVRVRRRRRPLVGLEGAGVLGTGAACPVRRVADKP